MNKVVFWHRRDLRIEDNAGLYHALKSGVPVLPIFIFDTEILSNLSDRDDPRVHFIFKEVKRLKKEYEEHNSTLLVLHGSPLEVMNRLIGGHSIAAVYSNRDYEPYARERDNSVNAFLQSKGIDFHLFKDQVIFECDEVLKDDGTPYTVFTPYSKKWKNRITPYFFESYPSKENLSQLAKEEPKDLLSLKALGFEESTVPIPQRIIDEVIVRSYKEKRDFPSIRGTSRLSVHLRFGTISIRKLTAVASRLNESWLNELIWRDFYMMILYHFPHVVKSSFRAKYDRIVWRNNEEEFSAWCQGKTGYPIVDAGMRELNKTGFMHNRVRMIAASFLTKHLLIDWRWGEAYFARKLLDFELASNNGGWQWASGSGCDAAPYFRVFNPYLQTKKFDPELKYIKKWVPEFEDPFEYVQPIVEHKFARQRAIDTYKKFLGN